MMMNLLILDVLSLVIKYKVINLASFKQE